MEIKAAKIGMALFLATETVFFAGLISAYWVLRMQLPVWPPPGQPHFPVFVTGLNTVILLSSAWTLWRSRLMLTALLGAAFLSIQGYEWGQLIRFGMKTADNVYGGIYYFTIGAHALHMLVALVFLVIVILCRRRRRDDAVSIGIALCRMYWTFVVGVWPVLYVALYLM